MINAILMSATLLLSPVSASASDCCAVQAPCCKPGAACCEGTSLTSGKFAATYLAVEAKEGEKKEGTCDGCKEGDKAKDGDKAKEGKKDGKKDKGEKSKDKQPN